MEKYSSILLRDQKISYVLKRSRRARRMRLAIYGDGRMMTVTAPHFLTEKAIERFIRVKTDWVLEKTAFFREHPQQSARAHRADYLKHKEAARAFVCERVNECNRLYGFPYKKIFIKNQRTCWGSCSIKGNLNFNYKIVLLPQHLADYIIVHELCHLEEHNHSKSFWNLVAKTFPHYAVLRRELKKQSIRGLTSVG